MNESAKPQLTAKEKKAIMKLLRSGVPVASIAGRYNRGRQTIYDLRDKNMKTGSIDRKVKLDKKTRKRLLTMTRKDPTLSAPRLHEKIGADVSVATIRRAVAANTVTTH